MKASSEKDSFKLYARDIIHRPLHAELVTISTCYGAGSRAYTGEGLVGLSCAFLRAGAHNVIGALWEVSDASTPQLMDKLYGELEQGRSPEEALRCEAFVAALRWRLPQAILLGAISALHRYLGPGGRMITTVAPANRISFFFCRLPRKDSQASIVNEGSFSVRLMVCEVESFI